MWLVRGELSKAVGSLGDKYSNAHGAPSVVLMNAAYCLQADVSAVELHAIALLCGALQTRFVFM